MERIDYDHCGDDLPRLLDEVVADGEPRLIIANSHECAVLVPMNDTTAPLFTEPEVLTSSLEDAKHGVGLGLGAARVFLTAGENAIVFEDADGTPRLGLVDIPRYHAHLA